MRKNSLYKISTIIILIVFTSTSTVYPLPSNPDVIEGSADISVDSNTMNIDANPSS